MIIRDAKFITSAADRKGFVRPDKPMVAVCGKSNVGKSSFINMLANRNKLARTSAEPVSRSTISGASMPTRAALMSSMAW